MDGPLQREQPMAAILLTRDNIEFLKSESRRFLSGVRSSHLTEALAHGLGYRTHASLLASLTQNKERKPILAELDVQLFSERMASLGYLGFEYGSVMAVPRSSDLPDRIWLKFRRTDRAMNDSWFRECRDRNIPNVCIRTRRKYVELYWDCVSIDSRDEAHVQGERGSALMREMFKTYQGIARRIRGKSDFFGSSFVGTVDDLLPELADDLADAFFAMLYQPMRQQRDVA